MPKVIGKMKTTDADGIIVYGNNVATSESDKTPINKRIPQVYYAFNTSKNFLYRSAEDLTNGQGISYNEIPVNTIVFITGEGNAYIRLPNFAGSPNWKPLSTNESKIFSNKDDADEYASTIGKVGEIITVIDTSNNEVLVYKIDIGNVLTDVATSFLIQLYPVDDATSFTLTSGQSLKIGFTYNEKYGTDSTLKSGRVTYQIKRPSDENFVTISSPQLADKLTIRCSTGDSSDPDNYHPVYFDPSDYGYDFETGQNILQVTVIGGESLKSKTIQFNINVIDMYVMEDGNFSDLKAFTTSTITYPWRCYGAGVNKRVFIRITDDATGTVYSFKDPIDGEDGINFGTQSGNYKSTSINFPNIFPGKSDYHGTYTMEHYCAIVDDTPNDTSDDIRSDSKFFNLMYCPNKSSVPLISATCDKTEIEYGDTIQIKYAAYSYNISTEYKNNIRQTIYYYKVCDSAEEGAILVIPDDATPSNGQIRESDTGIETIGSGEYVKRIEYRVEDREYKNDSGEKEEWDISDYPDPTDTRVIFAELRCNYDIDGDGDPDGPNDGATIKTFKIAIGEVSGDYDLNPTDVPVFCHLSSVGKTNGGVSKNVWSYTNPDNGFTVSARLSHLNFINNGWVKDNDGATCLRLSGTATCTIPLVISNNYLYYNGTEDCYELDQTRTIKRSGRTFIFDFNIHDVLNYNTECLTWYCPSISRGLKVTPQAAYITSEIFTPTFDASGAITNKDDIPFVQIKDDCRIQLAIVIEYENASAGPMSSPDDNIQFIRMYINGELSKAMSFSEYAFDQDIRTLPFLKIGSTDAITDVYSIRVYDSPLRDYQVLQNYISDRATIKEKMNAYTENNIYSTSKGIWTPLNPNGTSSGIRIDYNLARKMYPCFLITGQMSPLKGEKTKVGIIFTKPDASNADNYVTDINCMDYYVQGDSSTKKYLCETNVQGTSSQIYAKKNYKFKFAKIKTSSYSGVTSYYVMDTHDPNVKTYCEYIGVDFMQWYGPGNEEYWERTADSIQTDTYTSNKTYKKGDIVYYRGGQYTALQDCNLTGTGDPDNCVFVPYIELADTNYLICNTNENAFANNRYYFVETGNTFYYNNDEIIGGIVIADDLVGSEAALSKNDITGSYYVHIGENDEISTSKVKYKLYQDGEKYKGDAESTICVKADYMSPDGINSDNGRMFPKLFADPVPPQANNPYGSANENVFIAIPGFRALMFRRDNEQSEIEFLGRYNFNYDKGNTKSFGLENDGDEDEIGITNTTKCQKWEYLDNKDDLCNFKSYKLYQPIESEDKTFIAALSAFESTYPDQGDLKDVGREPDYTHLQVLYSWILQRANFKTASTDTVATPYEYDGNYYYNERDYRLAIFKNEFEKHFKKSHVITYHICVETMAIVDNRAKNMFLTCYGIDHNTNIYSELKLAGKSSAEALNASKVDIKFTSGSIASVRDIINTDTGEVSYELIDWENSVFPIWYTSLYDMDSCGGVDNNGRNRYNYDVEIHDIYNYDSNGNPVYCFNGATSYFWEMVEEAFADDIQTTWNKLRSTVDTKLSYEILCDEYMAKGVATIPQVVYNEDQRFKYLDILTHGYTDISTGKLTTTSVYQYLCQGSKRYHKMWFLKNRMDFLDSKYLSPQYIANNISFRTNMGGTSVTAEDLSVDITPFITQYQYVAYGNANTSFGGKCKAGNTIHIKPAMGGGFQDIVITIYGASNIQDLGDLSNFYLSKLNFTSTNHLKNLVIGSHTPGYANRNLINEDLNDLGKCPLLQKFDITNCEAVTGEIDLSGNQLIQEIYAEGTSLSLVNVPNGGTLRIMQLPKTTSSIIIKNQQYIETFTLAGYDNLLNLTIENVEGIDVPYIINTAKNLRRARIIGVNWHLSDKEVLNKLMSCQGYTSDQTETPKCVLTGNIIVDSASSVNKEAWEEYWKEYIDDGSLSITVQSEAKFHYVSYNTFQDKYEIPAKEGITTMRKVIKTTPSDASAVYWYVEKEDDAEGGGNFNTYGKDRYFPALIAANGTRIDDESLPKLTNQIIVKRSATASYWCIDDNIITYSPDIYKLALFEIIGFDGEGNPELSPNPVSDNGSPILFKRIEINDYWAVNDDQSVAYSAVLLKAVLKDSNGNIVYTAKNQLIAEPVNQGVWYDINSSGNNMPVKNGIYTTEEYSAWLVEAKEISTEFIDNGESSTFTSEYPIRGNKMFSHWSPSENNIEENRNIYAHFIDGYTTDGSGNPDHLLSSGFFTYKECRKDALQNITGYAITALNTAAINATGSNNIVIPKAINGIPIIAIGDITVSSPSSIATITASSSIKRIYFEAGSVIETIAQNAFGGCTGLEYVQIPETVTGIGADAFNGCNCQIIWTGTPKIETIGSNAFRNYNCPSSSGMWVPCQPPSRNIPDSIVEISERAFYNSNVNIKWCNIPSLGHSKLKTIGNYAFYGSGASEFVLSSNLESIGDYAFDHASKITSITFPNSLKRIGTAAFNYCENLATVEFSGNINLEYIGDGKTVFDNTQFAGRYNDPSTHTEANHWVGSDGNKVLYLSELGTGKKFLLTVENTATNVVVAENTAIIAASAMEGVSTLSTLAFHTSADTKYINKCAFMNCTNLGGSITFPTTLEIISESAFEGCINLSGITIGNSTRKIEDRCFYGCTSLDTVNINEALQYIGDYVFYNNNFESITLPSTMRYIGDFAFNKCNRITNMTIPFIGRRAPGLWCECDTAPIGSEGDTCNICNTSIRQFINPKTYDSVFGYIFGYQINPNKISVGDNLRGKVLYLDSALITKSEIDVSENKTFLQVDIDPGDGSSLNMLNIKIENSKVIINYRLTEASSYTTIEMSNGTSVTESIFSSLLTSGVDYIVTYVNPDISTLFVYNIDYANLRNDDNITPTVQHYGPGEYDYEEYYIPESLVEINITESNIVSHAAFQNMSHLQIIGLNTNIKIIDDYAFSGCTSLVSLNGTTEFAELSNLESIGNSAFEDCVSLEMLTLPVIVTSVGRECFKGCINLRKLSIPESLVDLGEGCFDECEALTYNSSGNINYLGNTTSSYIWAISAIDTKQSSYKLDNATRGIMSQCFENCNQFTTIEITSNVAVIGDKVFLNCSALTSIACSASNSNFKSINGILMTNDESTIIAYPMGKSSMDSIKLSDKIKKIRPYACYGVSSSLFELPTPIEEIGENAFYNCAGLGSIIISDHITDLDDYMFYNCASASITFAGQITTLGKHTFDGCTKMTAPVLSNSIESIPEKCFSGCVSLLNSGNFVIPSSVSFIGKYAFDGVTSNVNTITFDMGSSLTTIGEYAFSGVTVQAFYLPETTVNIARNAFYKCGIPIITIPDQVQTIGEKAFALSVNLNTVTIGNGVTSIAKQAFYKCISLSTVYLRNANAAQVSLADTSAFAINAIDRVFVVPDGSSSSYCNASNWNTYDLVILDATDFLNGVTTLDLEITTGANPNLSIVKYTTPISYNDAQTGQLVTEDQKELTTVIWGDYLWRGPGNTTYWSQDSVVDGNLASITDTYDDTIDHDIGDTCVFYGCNFTCIRAYKKLPTTLDELEEYDDDDAFTPTYTWTKKSSVDGVSCSLARASQDSIKNLIDGRDSKEYVLCNSSYIQRTTMNAQGSSSSTYYLAGYNLDDNNKYTIKIINRGLWSTSSALLGSSSVDDIVKATIDNNIKNLGNSMFSGAKKMTSVNLPTVKHDERSDYTSVGASMFYQCSSISAIRLPSTVKSIQSSAFENCTSLTTINISNIEEIASRAFYNCILLDEIIFEKILSFGGSCFGACSSLKKVVIERVCDPEDLPEVTKTSFA